MLAVWAYLMAQFTDPGHLNYQMQKHLEANELNDRLFDWIMYSARAPGSAQSVQLQATRRSLGLDKDEEESSIFSPYSTQVGGEDVDSMKNLSPELKKDILDKVGANLTFRTCKPCGNYHAQETGSSGVQDRALKPPRARHCKFCDNCCMELDHHCYWIGNCIGLKNKKYFFQYGIYVFLIDMILLPRYLRFIGGSW